MSDGAESVWGQLSRLRLSTNSMALRAGAVRGGQGTTTTDDDDDDGDGKPPDLTPQMPDFRPLKIKKCYSHPKSEVQPRLHVAKV